MMKVEVTEEKNYETCLKIVDIDVMSIADRIALLPLQYRGDSRYHGRYFIDKVSGVFFVYAVLTLSGAVLPKGVSMRIPCGRRKTAWRIFAENKAFSVLRFPAEEYEEDEGKLKTMLREWAENNGIKFGE